MKGPKQKLELVSVEVGQLRVHPSAASAFLHTKKINYQINPEGIHLNCLAQKTFALPIAEYREIRLKEYSKIEYLFFANWMNLLIQDYGPKDKIYILLVGRHTSIEINHQAWLYALSEISFSVHKNSMFHFASEFFKSCPIKIQERLFPQRNTPLSKSEKSKILQVPRKAYSKIHRKNEGQKNVKQIC